ncbi:Uncharacterised protein [Mycobacterium tuberculosis]|uniref:Uncharacterized protein n=1 Tax=Mycobacterium tuberculosis TaxID=1773 RepID=A0A0U0QNP3_MYCTX|nr:Uncharacterised protein [Mycobacterium tuberculosis]COV10979.1 Uncharacterised protein [Mycobacterium tuberculosis]COV84521.1 Uncharacterised protein [Mycobacterium tuberculosis]COY12047.1 Uncharacterised protein [Mycobacterium tuberculosis]
MGLSKPRSCALASITACGGRGLRCIRLSSGENASEVRQYVKNDASASSTR